MHMIDPSRETVIIVHGTWAGLEPGTIRWYQPTNRQDGTLQGFIARLDAALQKRESSARCWAHCATADETIFNWSPGDNSWIERARAGWALGRYVAKLQNDGWRCHIVAHSHGGNVLVDALPQIEAAPGGLGKIITLGTPFIDATSPIARYETDLTYKMWMFNATVVLALLSLGIFNFIFFYGAAYLDFSDSITLAAAVLALPAVYFGFFSPIRKRIKARLLKSKGTNRVRLTRPSDFLVLSSSLDEAWQVLHHMRSAENPLAVKENFFSYLFSTYSSGLRTNIGIDLVRNPSFREKTQGGKHAVGCMFFVGAIFFLVEMASDYTWLGWYTIELYVALILLLPAFLNWTGIGSAFTGIALFIGWLARATDAALALPRACVTFFVRRKAWTVIVAMAMGLEGYRWKLPIVERHPTYLSDPPPRYEDIPSAAEQRALERRGHWVARHLRDVSETFSKLTATPADVTSLLQVIEEDMSLVHAAYYTEDECIARIADWIADRE
jgi:hypothetical protein